MCQVLDCQSKPAMYYLFIIIIIIIILLAFTTHLRVLASSF
jgi:hypothetical protein